MQVWRVNIRRILMYNVGGKWGDLGMRKVPTTLFEKAIWSCCCIKTACLWTILWWWSVFTFNSFSWRYFTWKHYTKKNDIERLHMTSQPPCWCIKTKVRILNKFFWNVPQHGRQILCCFNPKGLGGNALLYCLLN
jgi:hypothetical protein